MENNIILDKNIKIEDFLFENSNIRILANRDSTKVELAGLSIGPFTEGNDYEVKYWIGRELKKLGVCSIREDSLNASSLYKIQWTEGIQAAAQLASLPNNFYPRLRRILKELKVSSKISPEKMREYEYMKNLAQDILSSRLKKIVSLATTLGQNTQILRNLSSEEQNLYNYLDKIISTWKLKIVEGLFEL